MREMSIKMTKQVIAVLSGRPPTYPVNSPAPLRL